MLNCFLKFHSKLSAAALLLLLSCGCLGGYLFFQDDAAESNIVKLPPALAVTIDPSSYVQLEANQSQVFVANTSNQDTSLNYFWSIERVSSVGDALNGTSYLLLTAGKEASFNFLGVAIESCWLTVTAETILQTARATVKLENRNIAPIPTKQSAVEQNTNQQNVALDYQPTPASNSPIVSSYYLGSSYIIEADGAGGYRAVNGSSGTVAFSSIDAASVITSAWNAAPTFIRDGRYVCTSSIVAASGNLKLAGESRNGVVLAYVGAENAITIAGVSNTSMKNGVTVESLTIDGQMEGLNGIYLEKASVSRICNVEIRGFLNNGIRYFMDCWSGILCDSYIHDNGNAGIELGYLCNEVRISNCVVNDDKYGVLVSGYIDQLIVQNTQFTRQAVACIYAVSGIGVVDINANYFEYSNASLIWFKPAQESPITNGVIYANFFSIAKQYAINVDNTYNLVITGNRYQYCGEGDINFGEATHSNLVNEPLQTIRVFGLGTRNVWISISNVSDDTWALRSNNMNLGQNTIADDTSVIFSHNLAKKPIHVEVGWQSLGYGDWAWFADDKTITISVSNKGTYSFSWMAWY